MNLVKLIALMHLWPKIYAAGIGRFKKTQIHSFSGIFIPICFAILIYLSNGCSNQSQNSQNENNQNSTTKSNDLIIFHAGSLSIPFKEITKAYNTEHPEVKIILEAAGSVACARKITDLNKPCDIIASADYKLINRMLIPEYAGWNIKFATNELVIVFAEKSKYGDIITYKNCFDILLEDDVEYGRADPNIDPCGYRSVLSMLLAEKYYQKPGLTEKLLNRCKNNIRPKASDLIALLEVNAIDYFFGYRSVAEQHGLKYISLPDEINLKNPEYADYYSSAHLMISGNKPGEMVEVRGEPMIYGLSILKGSPNPELAKNFVEFVLNNEKGLPILKKNGQPVIVPASTETYNEIPDLLKKYAKE